MLYKNVKSIACISILQCKRMRTTCSSDRSCTDTQFTTVGFKGLSATPNSLETNLIFQYHFYFHTDRPLSLLSSLAGRCCTIRCFGMQRPAGFGAVASGILVPCTFEVSTAQCNLSCHSNHMKRSSYHYHACFVSERSLIWLASHLDIFICFCSLPRDKYLDSVLQ
jgi:hypothetical protein